MGLDTLKNLVGDSVMRGENGIYKQYTVMGCCWWDIMRSDIVIYRDGIFWKMLEYITKLWYLGPPEIFLISSPGRKLWMIGPHFAPTDPQSHMINCPEICYSTPKMPMLIGRKKERVTGSLTIFLNHGPTLEAWKTSYPNHLAATSFMVHRWWAYTVYNRNSDRCVFLHVACVYPSYSKGFSGTSLGRNRFLRR